MIDNEFPTYRAISSTAVLSLVLALASIFCFTSLWFLLMVAASVFAGLYSLRQIRKFPEVLTGAAYARIGIGVSLLFGFSAVSHTVSEDFLVTMDARAFSNRYIEIIKDKPISLALWYQQGVDYRKAKGPDQAAEELKKAKSPGGTDLYKEKSLPFVQIKERLKGEGETIRFSMIETKVIDGLTVYANSLLELDGPGTGGLPKEQFILLQLVKYPKTNEWVVQDIKYPYTPASVVATVQKPVDDGHGHSH